jgi:site-specific recombinase XerD
MNRIDNKRDKLIFSILYCTGLRRFEIVKLKVSDINFRDNYIKVIGKGNKERIVPIHRTTLDQISEYIKDMNITTWLFPSIKHPGQCMSCKRLNEVVQHYAENAGVLGVTPHRIRSHCASLLYKKGADIKAIQTILGHESINTTNIYTKNDLGRTMEEYSKAFK